MTDLNDGLTPSATGDLDALRRENDQLRTALTSRAEIEQAKGVLMAVHGCDEDEAFAMLVQQSQADNIKLRKVALSLLDRLRT